MYRFCRTKKKYCKSVIVGINQYSLQTNSIKDKFYWKLVTAKIVWQISEDVRRSASKYQQMYEDPGANISRHAKIFGQIWVDVRRSVGKYQQMCKDLLWANIRRRAEIFRQISADMGSFAVGKYQQTCKDLQRANISRYAKIIGQISEDLRRSFCKYQQTSAGLWANIRSCVNICGQISEDVGRSVGKYQQTRKDLLWANISRHVKISGHRVVWAQNNITTLCPINDTLWLSLIDQFCWERESEDLNFVLLQLFCCSHFLSADLACLSLSFLKFKVSFYTNCKVRPYTNCKLRPYTNCKVRPYTNGKVKPYTNWKVNS